MDTSIIITVVILTVFCIILYLLIISGKKKKESEFLQNLFTLAEKNNCQISEYERWNNSIIGIDRKRNYLFFIRITNENETTQQINLTDIQKVRVIESSRIVSIKESNSKVVDRIELEFSNINRNKPDTIVEFYNTAYDNLFLAGELVIAEKWGKIINDKIAE